MKKILIFIYIILFMCFETVESPFVNAKNVDIKPDVGMITIEKINLNRQFRREGNVDKEIVMLDSDFPDLQNSLLVLAAHSGTSPFSFFNYLYKLQLGDIIKITYDNKTYNYKIIDIYQVNKNGKAEFYKINNKRTLALITCTNNVKDKQTIYIAVEY